MILNTFSAIFGGYLLQQKSNQNRTVHTIKYHTLQLTKENGVRSFVMASKGWCSQQTAGHLCHVQGLLSVGKTLPGDTE